MITKTLGELQESDEASLCSTPWGVGGRTRPEDAALYLQYSVSRLELSEQVPESTRKSFERLRTLYAYGVLCYDLYTVAGDLARLVIEQATRERFLPFYNGVVTFVHDRDGSERVISARNWDEFQAALPPSRQWRLRLRSGHEPVRFNGMLTSLLRWARAEGLLAGQGERMRDEPRAWFRNYVAHPSYHLYDPGHAQWAIADLAQIINRLWGAPSGMPVRREPMVIAWSADTVTWNTAANLTPIPGTGDLTCVVVLADPEDPGLATTTPCTSPTTGHATGCGAREPGRSLRRGSRIAGQPVMRRRRSTACSCSATRTPCCTCPAAQRRLPHSARGTAMAPGT
jgi:hypothetical protein